MSGSDKTRAKRNAKAREVVKDLADLAGAAATKGMEFADKENPNHEPAGSSSGGEFASGGSSSSSGKRPAGASYSRGFSAKYAEQISKEGIKPHAGATYASTAEEVAHHYGVNQALVKDKVNQYAIVTFRGKGAAVYPGSPKSKKGDYAQMRGDTFFKFDKTISPDEIVSVKVFEVDVKNPKAKPRLVKQYKESGEDDGLLYVAATVNEGGELEYIKPAEPKSEEKSMPTSAINILTGKIHEGFTVAADQLVQRGYINQEQRIALSGLIGDMLGQFNAGIDPAVAQTLIDAECADAIANKDAREKYNENHDPDDGRFASGGGGGGGIGGAMPKVRNQTHYRQLRTSIESNLYSLNRGLEIGRVAGKPIDDDGRSRMAHQRDVLKRNLAQLTEHAQSRGFKETESATDATASDQKAHVAVEDMPRDQQRAVFAAMADGGNASDVRGIAKGNFIRMRGTSYTGIVHSLGSIPAGKTSIAGYHVMGPGGKRGFISHSDAELIAKELSAAPLTLYKQTDGRLRVFGWASNNRRDNDNPPEIITEAAHKEFMAYLDVHPKAAPEFWHWHTPGTRYAKADWWDYADGFTVYSGLVDVGKEKQAQAAAADGIGMSHGFHVLGYDQASKSITQYRTFEVSDLPITRAANPYTSFTVVRKEAAMPFSEAKKQYLLERLSAEDVAGLEGKTSTLKAAADAAGIEWKDLVDEKAAAPAKPADQPKDEAKKPKLKPGDVGYVAEEDEEAEAAMGKSLSEQQIVALIDARMLTLGKEIGTSVGTSVGVALKALATRMDAIESTAVESKSAAEAAKEATTKSLDDFVAEMVRPKTRIDKGFTPSKAASTKKDGEAKVEPVAKGKEEPSLPDKPGEDWFTKQVMVPAGLVPA